MELRKKILQINTVINSGSTGRIAEDIGLLAINRGWESYIAFGRNNRFSKSNKIKIGSSASIYFHVLLSRLFDRHGFGSKVATRKLIKKIDILKPDIIHLHNIHGYYINIELLFNYLKKANIHVVWTLHDCWAMTGHCTHFMSVNCNKWKTNCNTCPLKNEYPASLYFDQSNKNFFQKKGLFTRVESMTLVPVSDWLGGVVKESYLNKYPIVRIYNGIDLDLFFPRNVECLRKKIGVENKTVILGVASVWDKRKGLADFLRLSDLLKADEVVILVGVSQKIINTLPENIIGIRKTERAKELSDFYSLADVYLNLTWEDNFPTTNLESLACGTPVITYKTGGSPESITSDTGFVVDQGDLLSVRKSIDMIKSKSKAYYTNNCRNRAMYFYDKDTQFEHYFNLYKRLLEGG